MEQAYDVIYNARISQNVNYEFMCLILIKHLFVTSSFEFIFS